ncbi:MAG: NIPSNAP family protein [Rhodospirillales bacterium]|nr:NIPSNAP family protein [Rhodospirillales bacterium]MDE2200754.1 NIPSNAP family protein [Rhodospirillales bacterium]MDE2575757.1 NIPSNAP family protein [Rhodospirillales bacterium]
MQYEIATLCIRIGGIPAALEGIAAFTAASAARGRLLGVWTADIGVLNEIHVLRGFADGAELAAERRRTREAASPFNAGDVLADFRLDTYQPLPCLPPVTPGRFGAVYEIRSYALKPGGVLPTAAAWEAALPERLKLSPLTFAGFTTDGPARFAHIWPYASTNDRAATRAAAVAQGIWPPKGGPAWLTGDMRSTIALPAAFSPLA